jgi:uncharacterized protein YycO
MNVRYRMGLSALGLLACTYSVRRANNEERALKISPLEYSIRDGLERVQLMDGDILLRRTDGLRGRIARAGDRSAGYSHAGLVSLLDGVRTVIHATPDGLGGGSGHVVRTELSEFVAESTVVRVAVYRLRERNVLAVSDALRWAGKHAIQATPFDGTFNLSDSSAMYCTELIWRAYRVAGLTLADPTPRAAGSLFLIDSLLLLSSIQQSPLLKLVYASPQF